MNPMTASIIIAGLIVAIGVWFYLAHRPLRNPSSAGVVPGIWADCSNGHEFMVESYYISGRGRLDLGEGNMEACPRCGAYAIVRPGAYELRNGMPTRVGDCPDLGIAIRIPR